MMQNRFILTTVLSGLICTVILLAGCSTPQRLNAVPQNRVADAEIVGMPGIRYFIGGDTKGLNQDGEESVQRELAYWAETKKTGPLPPAHFLAISGGGDDGAYGAGLLCGWTAAGNRPVFRLVTGISTGALIAPFAFLGSKYDDQLREVYTNTSPKDILEHRGLLTGVLSDAMADNRPLWQLTEKYITEDFLREVAKEHAKGRVLLIGTTNLDARMPVIWNMGKIAASGHPNALKLFRSIMIASAAIPGAFPPVMIDVNVDGQHFQEMHVDGGAITQVFVYPVTYRLQEQVERMTKTPQSGIISAQAQQLLQRQRNLYVIRNARLDPQWAEVERRTLSIANRAVSSLIQTQGIGDLYRIYAITQRDNVKFNLAHIPATFNAPHREDFDTEYMRQLFQVGFDSARNGYSWLKQPPGF